jgi:hypothetical protein
MPLQVVPPRTARMYLDAAKGNAAARKGQPSPRRVQKTAGRGRSGTFKKGFLA